MKRKFKRGGYETAAISFDDFMAHPEASQVSGKSVSEMAGESLSLHEETLKKDRELKSARRRLRK